MTEIINIFENNKKEILDFIKKERNIFPKMFINIDNIFDEKFYDSIDENPLSFLLKKYKIFSIKRISDKFFFKSNIVYKNIYLFFSIEHIITYNDKKIKNIDFVTNSDDEVYIENGDFLIVSFLEKDFNFENLIIPQKEKNVFDPLKIKKNQTKNIFLKNLF